MIKNTYLSLLEKLMISKKLTKVQAGNIGTKEGTQKTHPLIQSLLALIQSDRFKYGLGDQKDLPDNFIERLKKHLNKDLFGRFSFTRLNTEELKMLEDIIKDPSLEGRMLEEVRSSVRSGTASRRDILKAGFAGGVLYWMGINPDIAEAKIKPLSEKDIVDAVKLIQNNDYNNMIDDLVKDLNNKKLYDFEMLPNWIRTLVFFESTFDPYLVSDAGAKGLSQLNEITVKHLAEKEPISEKIFYTDKIFDPKINLSLGIKYKADMIEGMYSSYFEKQGIDLGNFTNRFKFALAAYNWGPSVLRRKLVDYSRRTSLKNISYNDVARNIIPQKTQAYISNILTVLERLDAYDPKRDKLIDPYNNYCEIEAKNRKNMVVAMK